MSPSISGKTHGGGNDEKRFRFLKEILLEVKRRVPKGFPVLIKLNANDYTPKKGMTPPLTAKYAAWLTKLFIQYWTTLQTSLSIIKGHVAAPVRQIAGILIFNLGING